MGDLADLYRGEMTMRQLWVRIQALPGDSPLHDELREAMEAQRVADRSAALDDALTRYKPKG